MKPCIVIAILCVSAAAQSLPSAFEKEHVVGLEQNPPGVDLLISTVDGRSTYRASDQIRFKLLFTSKTSKAYTIETLVGMSDAGASDDFVVQLPGAERTWHSSSSTPHGVICCDSKRRYLTQTGSLISPVFFTFNSVQRFVQEVSRDPFLPVVPESESKPRGYSVFVQTGRVMRGWPRSKNEKYHGRSSFLVTSSNVLHLVILPNAPSVPRQ